MYEDRLKKFTSIFYKLAALYGNSEVFANFVKMSAIAIYNSFAKNNEMEFCYK